MRSHSTENKLSSCALVVALLATAFAPPTLTYGDAGAYCRASMSRERNNFTQNDSDFRCERQQRERLISVVEFGGIAKSLRWVKGFIILNFGRLRGILSGRSSDVCGFVREVIHG